ncbi:hypothetical protein [Proteiniborus sp. MB09-C3]|uniref:hypothetical protein n=1 Tax=Proteiniborus sp. MB09-C3 TaxID=3050072 RepID=UPI0025527206|nr:hypothetical protein [Proteiniborus sp. MB09-C3]WIV13476.1 hypothetical protein QO263_07145 [Proteiniborus sp. MB09-C3]
MKKQILYLSMVLALTACTAKNDVSSTDSSISTAVETNIDYKVDKTILSKGFQSIMPNVEVLGKERGRFFLVNLGVVECSMASIDSISRVNNEINIFTSIKRDWGKTDIVVPQFTLEIMDIEDSDLNDLKFNIVPTNYTPIELKFDKSQVLNKIFTQLKYTNNTMPSVSLIKENDKYIWNIKLNNTFVKDNPSSPIYMLKAKVDSNNGELIEAKPILLSDTIDKGKILDFAKDNLIAYVQKESVENSDTENIWLYDINSLEKQKVYSTHNYVYSAKFSPDFKKLAVIEHNGKLSDLYIVDLDSKLIQKITPMDYKHTWNIEWKDNNLLYGVNNDEDNKSSLILFDIEKNEQEVLFNVGVNVTSFDAYDDIFAFVEKNDNKDVSNIYIKENKKRLKKIDYGFSCEFISEDELVYTKNPEKEDKFELYMYDLKEHDERLIVDLDVRKFVVIDEGNILIISKNNSSTDYSAYLHNLKDNESTLLGQVLDKNIFYSPSLNTAFFNVVPSAENSDSNFIYGINFDRLIEYEKDS